MIAGSQIRASIPQELEKLVCQPKGVTSFSSGSRNKQLSIDTCDGISKPMLASRPLKFLFTLVKCLKALARILPLLTPSSTLKIPGWSRSWLFLPSTSVLPYNYHNCSISCFLSPMSRLIFSSLLWTLPDASGCSLTYNQNFPN